MKKIKKAKKLFATVTLSTMMISSLTYAGPMGNLSFLSAGVERVINGVETEVAADTAAESSVKIAEVKDMIENAEARKDSAITSAPNLLTNNEETAASDDLLKLSLTISENTVNEDQESDEEQEVTEEQSTVDEDATEPTSLTAGVDKAVFDSEDFFAENGEDETDSEEEEAGSAYGYTNLGIADVSDNLNVRETADDDSNIVGKMTQNTAFEILDIEGNKAHIVSGSVEGYVSQDYILTGREAVERAESVIRKLATVTADGLKLREEMSTESEMINVVSYGEELEVVEELGEWVQVIYDETTAYVSSEYVTVDSKLKTALNMTEFMYGEGVSDIRIELCEYAKQFIGNPYVWGGTSLTKGADCSGFVQSVFRNYGISLPRTSREQVHAGTNISMSDAKPGDLIFYTKGGRINHVALYIGGGQVCHASSPKTGIRISSAYYRTPYKVARVLPN